MDNVISKLMDDLWEKEIGAKRGRAEKWVGKKISDRIEAAIGYEIEKKGLGAGAPHPDTIINFLNSKTIPSKRTLTIITWYLYGSKDVFVSFDEFYQKTNKENLLNEDLDSNTPEVKKKEFEYNKELKFSRYYVLCFIVFVFGGLLLFLLLDKDESVSFYDEFKSSNLDSLRKNGNYFLHSDSIDLNFWDLEEDRNSGFLTMRTYLGDSWLDNSKYNPTIQNILMKRVHCGECCEITLKLIGFNPTQKYQNAGIFLFGSLSQVPSIRYSLVGDDVSGRIQVVKRVAKFESMDIFPFIDKKHRQRGKVYSVKDEEDRIRYILLSIRFQDQHTFFNYSTSKDSTSIMVGATLAPFESLKYIGLYASQGRPDIPSPIYPVADVIPANFASIEVKSCEDVK